MPLIAHAERLPATVANALKAAGIPRSAVGIVVQDASGVSPRLTFNADRAMNPASTMKLLTTFAGLELLGPAFTWKTTAWSDAPLDDGVLAGDLYLRGSADPKLTFEQFWLLLRDLRARGVRDVAGDLVLDRSLLAPFGHDPAAFDEKPLRPYNVGPDALLLNFKTVRLTLVPDVATQSVRVLAEPEPTNLDVVNLMSLDSNGCPESWRENLHADLTQKDKRWRLVLTGVYPASCEEKAWRIGLMAHDEYVRGVFEQLWTELGGTLKGGVRDGVVPETARQLATIESQTLAEMVRDINKYSNNVMARQLFLTMGAEAGHRPVRNEDADAVVRAWLDEHDLHFPELVLDNGSGLSRNERISAHNLARLLAAIWNSAVMPELVSSLPLSAVDGTMKKRLNGNGVAGQAHLKTGTLDGVKTIAGYVLDRKGRRQIVVFLVNHPNARNAQAAQDALLDWVYEGGP
ncbi:MAG: D-alanyl-D-alanine carboxypeptidase/D-alanyl-D-alanine-endopeptidase [Gammaproteobacteria bacterium]|nr:D-alanyl-D-alanine carboxypeptidase/D-alanyl-D-alanine-endopeptidase [Gammaproteobacteria bacterium]MBU1415719.1 D-alanyl-D-alanine carboxypeptidase/D-alanyl-D-alanine-endopeptidase [Gammaproteobacteria bacterium]